MLWKIGSWFSMPHMIWPIFSYYKIFWKCDHKWKYNIYIWYIHLHTPANKSYGNNLLYVAIFSKFVKMANFKIVDGITTINGIYVKIIVQPVILKMVEQVVEEMMSITKVILHAALFQWGEWNLSSNSVSWKFKIVTRSLTMPSTTVQVRNLDDLSFVNYFYLARNSCYRAYCLVCSARAACIKINNWGKKPQTTS